MRERLTFHFFSPIIIFTTFFITRSKDGSTIRYVGTVRYASIFAKKYGTLVRYAFFVMVRVRYDGTVRLFCSGTSTVRWYAVWIRATVRPMKIRATVPDVHRFTLFSSNYIIAS